MKEGKKTLELFVGAGRGGLSPTQRAEVLAFAQNWRRDATGGVTIDRPVGGANERAANDTLKEALSIIVQRRRAQQRHRHPARIRPGGEQARDPAAQLSADGRARPGPAACGPTISARATTPSTSRTGRTTTSAAPRSATSPPWSTNPHDLVQPRAETPAYTAKRTFGVDKWRKGESPATTYPDANKGAISDLGK